MTALLDPDRAADDVDAMLDLLNDSGARHRASEMGRARAFRWDRYAGVLVEEFGKQL